MPRLSTLSTTFAGFPVYDTTADSDAQIAVIGIPYLSPYPVQKSYDSQKAAAAIRQILNFMGVAAHSGQFSQRRTVPPA